MVVGRTLNSSVIGFVQSSGLMWQGWSIGAGTGRLGGGKVKDKVKLLDLSGQYSGICGGT